MTSIIDSLRASVTLMAAYLICLAIKPKPTNDFTIYRVRHKSVNTPLSHERLVVRTWLALYALPATTIYCEPGAYDKPFVG